MTPHARKFSLRLCSRMSFLGDWRTSWCYVWASYLWSQFPNFSKFFPTSKFLFSGNLAWKRQITSVRCIHKILFCLKDFLVLFWLLLYCESAYDTFSWKLLDSMLAKLNVGQIGKTFEELTVLRQRRDVLTGGEQYHALFSLETANCCLHIPLRNALEVSAAAINDS